MKTDLELQLVLYNALDNAERIYKNIKDDLIENKLAVLHASAAPSLIPGHPQVDSNKPAVDNFIAFALDMRNSSTHLNCACNNSEVQMLERVFYETSALLAVCSEIVNVNGSVTEYLGDGLLGFYRVTTNKAQSCYDAYNAAKKCIDATQNIINPELRKRYKLDAISIGVGMAYSQAVVTLTGNEAFAKPVAFGKCVFNATKLSKGDNEIIIDDAFKNIYPTGEKACISFRGTSIKGMNGYIMDSIKPRMLM